jgi:hypothetical protein
LREEEEEWNKKDLEKEEIHFDVEEAVQAVIFFSKKKLN